MEEKNNPTLIDRVQDRRGKTIFRHDKRECVNCNGHTSSSLDIPLVVSKMLEKKLFHLHQPIKWYPC